MKNEVVRIIITEAELSIYQCATFLVIFCKKIRKSIVPILEIYFLYFIALVFTKGRYEAMNIAHDYFLNYFGYIEGGFLVTRGIFYTIPSYHYKFRDTSIEPCKQKERTILSEDDIPL